MPDNSRTYIRILIDTLVKKEKILRALQAQTDIQSELLNAEELDADAFDDTVKKKSELLESLQTMDEGFLDLYAKVGDELKAHPDEYSAEIKEAQALVRTQTDLSTELSAAEERNKNRLALYFSKGKQKVKEFKVSSAAASAYYKNMSGKHQEGDSYFFNKKK